MQKESSNIIRNLFIVFVLSTTLLIISIVGSLICINELVKSADWVNHTNEVLLETETLMSYTKDGETAQRGYLLTNNNIFLDFYEPVRYKTRLSLNKLKALTADNPEQVINFKELETTLHERLEKLDLLIKKYRSNKQDSSFADDMLEGKRIMDRMRLQVDKIKAGEKKLLDERMARLDKYTGFTPILIVLAALLSIAITIISFNRIKRETESRIKKQQEDENKYRETSERINKMEEVTRLISEGNWEVRSEDNKPDEIGRISKAINNMSTSLQENFNALEIKNWLESRSLIINDALRGQNEIHAMANSVLETMHSVMHFHAATFYTIGNSGDFFLAASYAASNPPKGLKANESITGRAIHENKIIVLESVPAKHLNMTTSLGETEPACIVIIPYLHNHATVGVMELAFLKKPELQYFDVIERSRESVSIGINSALNYSKLQELLEETQAQAEELQTQHSELESMNEELEAQAHKLQASEEELKVQQEELLQANTELEERSGLLQEKNSEIENKVKELALSTRYKSEFLANMSHELRTPLNSILLLSRLLADNNQKHLDQEEVEYAKVIQTSGNGLLTLINEILDLSKIETGKMELDPEKVKIPEVIDGLKALFGEMAKEKGIEFVVNKDENMPPVLETDKMRLEQILKNLISNAIKFTDKGSVTLSVKRCPKNEKFLCFTVTDTGIGIPKDKQGIIFEAFQQADGSTKRKYGGTGLGLSISRQLAKLLQGEIKVSSEVNKGSEFILYVPLELNMEELNAWEQEEEQLPLKSAVPAAEHEQYISEVIPGEIDDDRRIFKTGDTCILIVEDDVNFAKALLEFTRKKKYKGIVCVRGDEALDAAKKYQPKGVLLDIQLPVKSGWEVMDELKQDPSTRHIPVHIMSSHKVKRQSLMKGAVDFIDKPVAFEQMQEIFKKIEHVLTKNPKKVLIVEDNTRHAKALSLFLESFDIHSEVSGNIPESMKALKTKDVDCVILDMGIPAKNAYELLEEFKKDTTFENLPIIVFTGKSLSVSEEQRIKKYADTIVVKTAHSYQRMLDEVSLFLHLVEEKKQAGRKAPAVIDTVDKALSGKTVLVTDDDVRNIFSLTKALENVNVKVVTAVNGKESLQKLEDNPEIDIVLLDMMMPEMDGYETARRIRQNNKWKNLPVIAVTAKAMTGDREKCISAGASDYISKPVDIDQLLSLLRVWLYDRVK